MLNELLSEIVINLYPEWNVIQVKVFKKLQADGYRMDDIVNNMPIIGKKLRDYMDKNHTGIGWEVDEPSEELENDLFNVAKSALKNKEPVSV